MQILLLTGYRDIIDCVVGDEVRAFDLVTGTPIVNTIEMIQPVDEIDYDRWWNGQAEQADFPWNFRRINGGPPLNAEQSIWRVAADGTPNICHVRDLILGDTIYDDADHDVVVASLQDDAPQEDFIRIWYGDYDPVRPWENSLLFWPAQLLGNHTAAEIDVGDSFTFEAASYAAKRIEPVKGWWRLEINGDHSYIADGVSLHNASRFWVGSTGSFDGTTTHWSATTGGASGASSPGSADTTTWDGASGGGTTTIAQTVTIQSITCGGFTGTWDNSVNNNTVSLSATSFAFNNSGAGTRSIKLGSATYNLTGTGVFTSSTWTCNVTTGLTWDAGTSTIKLLGGGRISCGSNLTYRDLEITGRCILDNTGFTFNTITANAEASLELISTGTITITNLVTNGSLSSLFSLIGTGAVAGSSTIINSATSIAISFAALKNAAFGGAGTWTAPSSYNLGSVSGITITPPSAGGGIMINPGLSGGLR